MSGPYGICDACGEYHELDDVGGELLCEECQFEDSFPGEPVEDDDEDSV